MTMDLLREKAVRSITTACVLALILAVSSADAQTAAAGAESAKDADIDAFLANLQRTSDAARPAVPAKAPDVAAAPLAEPAPAPVKQAPVTPAADEPNATQMTDPEVEFASPAPLSDDTSPFRTLLLMFGGIAICALATIGLTLTFFALRRDMKKKRRARQRRFVPYPPKRSNPVAQA